MAKVNLIIFLYKSMCSIVDMETIMFACHYTLHMYAMCASERAQFLAYDVFPTKLIYHSMCG